MPRPHRPLVAGGVYHVTARGNRDAAIFHDDADRLRFLHVFGRICARLRWSCLAWCLMTTHYHLLVRMPQPDLAVGMQRLNGNHATYFNVRHGVRGHLFGGRYHSVLVETDSHLLTAVRYIALNPVAAGLCSDPAGWRWSSHRALLGLEPPTAVDVPATLAHFAADGGDGRQRYAEFLGVPLPPPSTATAGALCPPPRPLEDALRGATDAEAIAGAYFDDGYGTGEIAAKLGLGQTTIRRRLQTAGVRPPPGSIVA